MTAEIAILNKSAVALAADSAVSIGRSPNFKIYNTVNKIFELSAYQPVGVMIYGRLDFMGLPLETIIKEYRKHLGETSFPHVKGYLDNFRSYLSATVPVTTEDRIENAALIVSGVFEQAFKEIEQLVFEDMAKRGAFKKSKLNGIAQAYIKRKIDELKKSNFAPGFSRKTVPAEYDAVVNDLAELRFRNLFPTATTKRLAHAYAGYVLSKSSLSQYRTGIVIAGFGTEELCPSLERFELDGIIDGRLKYAGLPETDISRRGPEADILGFAQDDMMKSFLEGIDPTIGKYLFELMDSGIVDAAKSVLKGLLKDDAKVDTALTTIEPILTKMKEDAKKKAEDYIEKKAASPIRDMVRSMPKQELSNLAASLIEITSLKRKVSREQETVGGDVDVAIISKDEGFVWTQRKHYFPAELNPRFFNRHYPEIST